MTDIKELKLKKASIEFEPIALPDVDENMLSSILDEAEIALMKYKKMLEGIKQADSVSDNLNAASWLWDFMTDECGVPSYDDCAVDIIFTLKKHLETQVAKFTQFCDDLESEIECIAEHGAGADSHGSYDRQVRSTYIFQKIGG